MAGPKITRRAQNYYFVRPLGQIGQVAGAVASPSAVNVTLDSAENITANMDIQIGSEIMRVTAVANNRLTITRAQRSTAAAAIPDNAPVLGVGLAEFAWTNLGDMMKAFFETRIMEFDPGTPSSPEESESSYGDDQAFTFSGAEQSGTASIQVLEATAADGRLVATQAAAAKRIIEAAVDVDVEVVRLRTSDVSRESSGEYPASPTIANAAAYYFRGKKRNPRAIDGSPMDRYGFDIVLNRRPVRVEAP